MAVEHNTHHIKFFITQKVFLVSDPEQLERIITAIYLLPNNQVVYCLSYNGNDSKHYDFEISDEEDVVKKTR